MKYLNYFTPAEAFLILYPQKSSRGDLLKATCFDLLMKGVLRTHSEIAQAGRDRPRTLKYIIAGESLNGYQYFPHESVFLSPYLKNGRIKMMISSLAKIGYENSNSEKWYKTEAFINQPRLNSYFNTSFLFRLFGIRALSPSGKEMQKTLFDEIAQMEKELEKLQRTNKLQAADLVSKIGGCIILLENFESDILNEIDVKLKVEFDAIMATVSGGANSCSSDWGTSWDSGCGSSCSSCSSCSGCGGCGGCN